MKIKEFIFHVVVLVIVNAIVLLISRPTTVTAGVIISSILGYCLGGVVYRKLIPKLRKKKVQ